ncbi:MAG: thiamine biosynthesis protein ThiF [Geodermatophilaceae bacterium]|nr:thiamine biosynthesis protein ThiF [Geodermatophilaceae bacterium]
MALRPRPTIKPWLPKVWRDHETLQIGIDPTDGVLVSGVDAATAIWLTGLDGSRTEAETLADAEAVGLDIATAVRVLSGLSRSGVLLSTPIDTQNLGDAGALLPELVSLIAAHASPLDGGQALTARSRLHIVIDGANRIGVPLGALLAASGVGRLSFLDAEYVRRCDAGVGGLSLEDEGEPRVSAAQHALRRISAMDQSRTVASPQEADLLILCQPWSVHDPLQARGLSDRTAHLAVAVRDGTVVIGPLVLPGRTSCLRCAEMHRTDRDSRWPAVAAQLVAAPNRAVHEPTNVLSTLAAALAAGQVLDHLDGTRVPDVLEATMELRPPDWQLHRRPWPPHADCGCLETSTEHARVAG